MLAIFVKFVILFVALRTLKKHLPCLCEFSDNEILSSYAKEVYSYYDIEQIEEFVAFKGAYEGASVGFRVPAKPLRFELWGAHEDLSLP